MWPRVWSYLLSVDTVGDLPKPAKTRCASGTTDTTEHFEHSLCVVILHAFEVSSSTPVRTIVTIGMQTAIIPSLVIELLVQIRWRTGFANRSRLLHSGAGQSIAHPAQHWR